MRPLPLAPDSVVLEVKADQKVDDLLLLALREAREAGFRIALDGFRADAGSDALLDLADSVKLDVSTLDEEAIEAAVNIARGRGLALIADGVQTRDRLRLLPRPGLRRLPGPLLRRTGRRHRRLGARRTGSARCRCSRRARAPPSSSSSA